LSTAKTFEHLAVLHFYTIPRICTPSTVVSHAVDRCQQCAVTIDGRRLLRMLQQWDRGVNDWRL